MQKVKDQEKILKAREKGLITYKETPVRLTAVFSAETVEARGYGITYLKCSKKKLVNIYNFNIQI